MVKVIDYKSYQSEDGKEFYALQVQGGLEAVKSKETGRTYLTVRKATVFCTFDKENCEMLKGSEIPGSIKKVDTEPFEYTIPDSGEIVMLSHRFEYIGHEETNVSQNVIERELVV